MDMRASQLLQPVEGVDPCGDDMSFSPEFDQIQEARREDDPTVDYGEWQTELKQADWRRVIERCGELLRTRSKDLRLAAWMAEAQVKTSGLNGLNEGLNAVSSLLAHFGRGVHPRGDDEQDHERRIGTVSWFVMRMAQLVRQIPITRAKTGNYGLGDHESAQLRQAQIQRGAEPAEDAEQKVTLEKFASAVAQTDRALYVEWIDQAGLARISLRQLIEASNDLFGADGPSFAALEEAVEAVCRRLELIGRELGMLTDMQQESASPESFASAEAGGVAPTLQQGPIASRAQAISLLRQVAAYFHHAEPHSPVAYLADKAATWGEMPLHAWLRTVVKDGGTLCHIEELLGLKASSNVED